LVKNVFLLYHTCSKHSSTPTGTYSASYVGDALKYVIVLYLNRQLF